MLRKERLPHKSVLEPAFIAFICASIISTLFAEHRWESFLNLKNLLLVVVVYLLAATVAERRVGRRLAAVLMFSAAGSSAYGVAVFLLHKGEGTLDRTPGPFSTAMTYGGLLMLLCSLFTALAVVRGLGKKLRLAACSLTLLAFSALFLSFTRSSWLGICASIVVVLVILGRRLLIPFAALLVLLFLLLPAPFRERVTSIWDLNYRTNVQRVEMIRGGWNIFKDHPFSGVGLMDLGDVYERYKPPGAVFVHGHMHNIFLQVAASMGILGLTAFCFLFYSFYRLLVRNLELDLPPPERAWVAGSIGAVTGFLVNGLFEWNFGDAEVVTILYVIIGSNLAIHLHRQDFEKRGKRGRAHREPDPARS